MSIPKSSLSISKMESSALLDRTMSSVFDTAIAFAECGCTARTDVSPARIFGTIPIQCPKCRSLMELKEFILDDVPIERMFPDLARAPPQKQFERIVPDPEEFVYGTADEVHRDGEFDQTRPDNDSDYNQDSESL